MIYSITIIDILLGINFLLFSIIILIFLLYINILLLRSVVTTPLVMTAVITSLPGYALNVGDAGEVTPLAAIENVKEKKKTFFL